MSDRLAAYALYIDPPLGRVGLTEREARATGRPVLVGRRPMPRVARAVETGETQGFMKILVDAESKRIVGAAILGTGGDEAIHGILDVMTAGVPATTLRRSMPIHPTVSELIPHRARRPGRRRLSRAFSLAGPSWPRPQSAISSAALWTQLDTDSPLANGRARRASPLLARASPI